MTELTPFLEKIAKDAPSLTANLFRYCLGDQVPLTLDAVLHKHTDPITYAGEIEKARWKIIPDQFCRTRFNNCPDIIKRAWVYDQVACAALLYRMANILAMDEVRLFDVVVSGSVYLLNTSDPKVDASHFGGLTHFTTYAIQYIDNNPKHYDVAERFILDRLLEAVGNVDQPSWMFWNKKWQRVLENRSQLILLRRFLYAAFAFYELSDFEELYYMTRDDLLGMMVEFTELVTSTDTTKAQIDAFIEDLRPNFNMAQHAPNIGMALEAPFYMVDMYYRECGEDHNLFYSKMVAAS